MSSARVVRGRVKSRNESNPYCELIHVVDHSSETAGDKTEEGGDDVKSACPLWPGLHTDYNGRHTEGSKTVKWSKSLKAVPVQIAGCNPPACSRNC